MGVTGTDVAKEAADVILTNDNFATITSAIEEGRAVFDNLRKFITYIFSSNVPEILPFMFAAMLNIPLALKVKQILAIDLGTDLLPALALGIEQPEPDVMQHPPRKRSQRLVNQGLLVRSFLWLGMIEAALCYLGFYFVMQWADYPFWDSIPVISNLINLWNVHPEQQVAMARTVFYAGVVMAQVGNIFACRTERNRGRRLGWLSNRLLLMGVGVEIAILLALIYFPPVDHLFELLPLPIVTWVGLGFYPLVLYSLDWIRKGIVRWREPSLSPNHAISEKEVI
jgi:magnesium-transporting ATPase (P-type)